MIFFDLFRYVTLLLICAPIAVMLVSRPILLIWAWLAAIVVRVLVGTPAVGVAGITVGLEDVLAGLSLIVIYIAVLRKVQRLALVPLALATWVLARIVLSALQTSASSAFSDARRLLPLFLCIALVAVVRPDPDNVIRPLVLIARLLAVVALIRLVTHGGIGNSAVLIDPVTGAPEDQRLLPAAASLFIGQAAIMRALATQRTRWQAIEALLMFGLVIVLQHRTVWVCMLIGLIAGMLTSARVRRSLVWLCYTPLLPAAFLAVIIAVQFNVFAGGAFERAVREPFRPDSTANFRLELWSAIIAKLNDLTSWLFGRPFGSGYTTYLRGQIFQISPHSIYVEMLVRCGLIGVVLLIALAVRCQIGTVNRMATIALTLSVVVYGIAYTPNPEQGVLVGLAYVLATTNFDARKSGIGSTVTPNSAGRKIGVEKS